jgi:hypothetical protein
MSDSTPSATEIRESAERAMTLGIVEQELVTTPFKGEDTKGCGIDWIVEKFAHHALVAIMFEKEDDEGYNVFNVAYNKKVKPE